MKALAQKHIRISFLVVFFYKLVCVDDRFSKPIVLYRGKNAAYKLIEAILKQYEYYKKFDHD